MVTSRWATSLDPFNPWTVGDTKSPALRAGVGLGFRRDAHDGIGKLGGGTETCDCSGCSRDGELEMIVGFEGWLEEEGTG